MNDSQGRPRSTIQNFASLDAFYGAADPRLRQFSPELDYGVHWTDPPLPNEIPGALPRWRVSWVERTGELYAVCDGADASGQRPVRVYGVVGGRDEIEAFLEGWSDHCGPGGLAWLEERFAERALPTPAPVGGATETVVIDPSPELLDFVAELGERADKVKSRQVDPFPLLEEVTDPRELPTADEWLDAGAPLREVTLDPDQGPDHGLD